MMQRNTIIGKDGAEMALIPAGEFEMGSNDGRNDEKPVHTVYLDAFSGLRTLVRTKISPCDKI